MVNPKSDTNPADLGLVDPELLRQRQFHAAQQGKPHAGDQ